MSVEISFHGPLFTDGQMIADRMVRDITTKVTAETEHRVRVLGQSMFRYADKSHHQVPGKWRNSVHGVVRGDEGIIDDGGIIYGPWLEGVGSRNRTTRFKGYFMWRRTAQNMERSGAAEVARPVVAKAVRELNG